MSKASHLRQRAQDFLKKGQFKKAIEEYRHLLTLESRNPNLYNDLGDVYLKAGDRIQAVSSFEKAVTNYEKVALYNNAVAVCKKILRVVPNRINTIFKLGELRAKQKFEGEAHNYFSLFLEGALADPENQVEGIQEKIATVLELLPQDEGIFSKAADVYSQIGLKIKAVELLNGLVSQFSDGDDPRKIESYRNRLEVLKSSLNSEDLKEINRKESEERDTGEAAPAGSKEKEALTVEEGVPSVSAGNEMEASVAPEAEREVSASDVRGTGSVSDEQPSAAEPGERDVQAIIEEAADESDITVPVDIDEPSAAPTEVERASEETVTAEGSPTEGPAGVGIPGGEEEASETAPLEEVPGAEEAGDDIRNLAEEITSDIEEGDYRSHYDLGMAYIEMALYGDAIRELQIASRSDQLQLKSIEMIGYCFLQQNNPRLAVKQLLRGLDMSGTEEGEKLGIHYNLGMSYEMLGDMEKAREHFEEVYIIDVTFRDIEEKMSKFSTVS